MTKEERKQIVFYEIFAGLDQAMKGFVKIYKKPLSEIAAANEAMKKIIYLENER